MPIFRTAPSLRRHPLTAHLDPNILAPNILAPGTDNLEREQTAGALGLNVAPGLLEQGRHVDSMP
jgi:hypothetical protein